MSDDDKIKTRLERIADRDAPLPRDQGYRETELGGLKSTIAKLSDDEILDRVMAKALHSIHEVEDRRVFAALAMAASGFDVIKGGR